MTTQLTLLPSATTPWHLDDTTRAIGRNGLAQARQALAAARHRAGERPTGTDPYANAA